MGIIKNVFDDIFHRIGTLVGREINLKYDDKKGDLSFEVKIKKEQMKNVSLKRK